MKTGVNKNGVRWIKEGNKTICTYQLSSDVELIKTFVNTNETVISNLTGIQLLNEQPNVKKK